MARVAAPLLFAALVALSAPLAGQKADTTDTGRDAAPGDTVRTLSIAGIVVTTPAPRTAASSARFETQEILLQAASTSADILRVVPGLAVAQHAGGGKADQYLIRGFDADHGTDFALFVEGIPVNMVSHAHGQGYADLGHVIPETVGRIDLYKGPYFAEFGNLSTAGTSELRIRDDFTSSFVQAEGGNFGTGRLLGVWSPEATEKMRGFVAASASRTDGPFVDPQGFDRLNATTRWALEVGDASTLTAYGSAYDARWDASGQIPLRAVQSGRIGRFGTIDPTEGGHTRRLDGLLRWEWDAGQTAVMAEGWASRYEMDLWSNFTFRLNDPVDGDGIVQRDRRNLHGGRVRLAREYAVGLLSGGVDLRIDHADVLLGQQEARVDGPVTVHSDLRERNLAFWLQQEVPLGRYGRVLVGLRHDRFDWDVADRLGGELEGRASRDITLPKASLIVTPTGSSDLQLFANWGRGFHGNDARTVVAEPGATVLAAANGFEVGALKRFGRTLEVSAAWWQLDLAGELVWVGDEGVTALSGPTRRHGPEVDATWRPAEGLFVEGGFTHTSARYRDSDDIVARAPRWTWRAGAGLTRGGDWSGALKVRGVADIPLEESGTAFGEGATIVDLTARRTVVDGLEVGLQVENVLDTDVKEAQTWFASRLPGEPAAGIQDNHFTPGLPRAFRISLRWMR